MGSEVWRNVAGFESYYEVSDAGNVRRKGKGGIMKPGTHRDGYKTVVLSISCKSYPRKVHRLVATAFIENPKKKEQVNHINGIKSDNRLVNLEWATRSENTIHAYKTGLIKHAKISKLSESAARDIKLNCVKGVLSRRHFAEKYNTSIANVGYIVTGARWKHLTE